MNTADQIVEAARAVFSRHGFRGTNMSLIGEAAGLTRQAVYHHFSSKEEIYGAVARREHVIALATARERVAQTRAAGGDIADVLAAAVDARYSFINQRLAASPHEQELVQAWIRHSQQIIAEESVRFVTWLNALIAEEISLRGLRLAAGIGASDLGLMLQAASRGVYSAVPRPTPEQFTRNFAQMTRIIVQGALRGARREEHAA